jgi:hypothetical protein
MALYIIQRRNPLPRNPGPDYNPDWCLTWWDDINACWVDDKASATRMSKSSEWGERVLKELKEGNANWAEVTFEPAPPREA